MLEIGYDKLMGVYFARPLGRLYMPENSTHANIPSEVESLLKHYVHVYSDPRNGRIFYISQGSDNRAFQHLSESNDSDLVSSRKSTSCGTVFPDKKQY